MYVLVRFVCGIGRVSYPADAALRRRLSCREMQTSALIPFATVVTNETVSFRSFPCSIDLYKSADLDVTLPCKTIRVSTATIYIDLFFSTIRNRVSFRIGA